MCQWFFVGTDDEGTDDTGSIHDEFPSGHQSVVVVEMSLMSGFLRDL